MNDLLRALGRALASILHPRMLWLTVSPCMVAALGWGILLWLGWDKATALARAWLGQFGFADTLYHIFGLLGLASLHVAVAPFLVTVAVVPIMAVTALLLSAAITMPAVLRHVGTRYYDRLEARRGGTWYGSLAQSLWATLLCLLAMALSAPLWLAPPLFALIPLLLWGWLTYRVMTYDALAAHASRAERLAVIRVRRVRLLAIGVVSGLLGSLPTLVWVSSVALLVLFPLVAMVTLWLYVLIFVFSALWFAYYCLHALQRLRAATSVAP